MPSLRLLLPGHPDLLALGTCTVCTGPDKRGIMYLCLVYLMQPHEAGPTARTLPQTCPENPALQDWSLHCWSQVPSLKISSSSLAQPEGASWSQGRVRADLDMKLTVVVAPHPVCACTCALRCASVHVCVCGWVGAHICVCTFVSVFWGACVHLSQCASSACTCSCACVYLCVHLHLCGCVCFPTICSSHPHTSRESPSCRRLTQVRGSGLRQEPAHTS
uniref:Uncharacterized protein n=1 Tax=Molossus molossus TaxID=27622 RepID=A0A7J8GKW4_MOLMO|nr:hypothetical protein HJG59_011514 [Molossus molossus]